MTSLFTDTPPCSCCGTTPCQRVVPTTLFEFRFNGWGNQPPRCRKCGKSLVGAPGSLGVCTCPKDAKG